MEKVERLKQVRTDVGIALLEHQIRLDELQLLSKPNARDNAKKEAKKSLEEVKEGDKGKGTKNRQSQQ